MNLRTSYAVPIGFVTVGTLCALAGATGAAIVGYTCAALSGEIVAGSRREMREYEESLQRQVERQRRTQPIIREMESISSEVEAVTSDIAALVAQREEPILNINLPDGYKGGHSPPRILQPTNFGLTYKYA